MPYRIAIDGDRRLIVKPDGRCDLADSLAMLQVLAIHDHTGAANGALLDLRNIDYTPSFLDVQTLAQEAGREVHMPVALVVEGALGIGIAHQFATFATTLGTCVGVFADPDAAVDWLRVDEHGRRCPTSSGS
jgi:hypothetical protein